ncbi:hypothetical protein [Saccharomonospora cyanea]|uniref:Uncharacterized protein n=1 Tax=Saccharomonospora cyanea NA-134 TaxID=882082 RepID=H5XG65_9PSEU|nr:hypothetical protein [Saccharomonospora cyanea]EHR62647.1 hypothetical protein SaccyDRAFT_3820 [Saccharomonospora cyanea NA-134]
MSTAITAIWLSAAALFGFTAGGFTVAFLQGRPGHDAEDSRNQ